MDNLDPALGPILAAIHDGELGSCWQVGPAEADGTLPVAPADTSTRPLFPYGLLDDDTRIGWDGTEPTWPTGLDYTHLFDRAEVITAPHHVNWHLGDLLDDLRENPGTRLIFQTAVVEADTDDEDDDDNLVGWALVAKVVR